ncbi:MAG TPA: PAS domain S-box protein [Anaerolineales bacterium]|nr:PAS domain S-box protein [Anaerolineales bacterium]
MTSAVNRPLISSYKNFADHASRFVIAIGLLVLAGWVFDIPTLKTVFPGLNSMKVNTALSFVLCGIALRFVNRETSQPWQLWLTRILAFLVTLLGLLTLGQYALGRDFGIDQFLIRDTDTSFSAYPGRISITTAIDLVLIGISLFTLSLRARGQEEISQSLAIIAGVIGLLAFIGYLYDVESLHRIGPYSSMALHSALGFMVLSAGICCARPDRGIMNLITTDFIEGEVIRRLLPVLFGMPIIIGWLSLLGIRGGLYDIASGFAMMAILTTALLSLVVWWNAGWLRRADRKRKEVEKELRYQARLLSHINDAVIATDERLEITAWNRAAERIYGWKSSEVIGRNVSDVLRLEWSEREGAEARQRLQDTLSARTESLQRRKGGEAVYVEANTIALADEAGEITGFVSVNRDVTERKQAEQAAIASQKRFQSLIEHAPDGIALLGIDGKLRQVTPSTQQILGYSLEQAVDQDPALLTHPDDLAHVLGILNDLIQNPGNVVTTQYRFKHRDGSWRWLESTISNLMAEPSVEAIVFNYRDITSQKKAQEEVLRLNQELEQRVVERTRQLELANRELDNSRKEIQAILDSMSTLNAKVALDGTLLFVNKIAMQASGLAPDELMNSSFLEGPWWTFDPEVHRRVKEAFARARSGAPVKYDERIFVFGQVLTIDFSLTPMVGEDGRVEYILAEARDITKLKQAEERFRSLLESAPDGVVIVNERREIVLLNPQVERLFGYPRSEIAGRHFHMLIPNDGRNAQINNLFLEFFNDPHQPHLRNGLELYGLRANGSDFPVEINLRPLQAEEGILVIASIRDVTERVRNREELIRERDLLRTLMDSIPDTIYFKDTLSRFTRVNKAQTFVLGISDPGEAIGKTDLDFQPLELAKAFYAEEQEIVETGQPLIDRIEFNPTADGRPRWFSATKVPIRDADGHVTGIVGISRDITQRRLAEEEIRRLNQDLKQRAAELETANKELESFSYSVSHDLRAPLRSIDGFSHAVLDDYGDNLPEEGRQYLRNIRAAAQRMGQLIDSLLSLAGVTRTAMERRPVDLSTLAERIAAELRSQQPARAVSFSIAKDLRVSGDSQLLRIALDNLIGNAWKFTSKLESASIEVGAKEQEGQWVYFVRDNGVGFDMRYKEKLFGTFQRLHSADEFPGAGIGLATVQRIIRRHGGRIWAESSPNQGTTFYFTLSEAKSSYST